MVMVLLLTAGGSAFAHKARPAVASLVLQDNNVLMINLVLNVEAMMAGIGPDHNPGEFAVAGRYARLRKLPANDLTIECAGYVSRLIQDMQLEVNGSLVTPTFIRCAVPDNADNSSARLSGIDMRLALPNNAKTFSWRWSRRLGIAAIRLNAGKQKEQIAYLQPGERSEDLRLTPLEEDAS